MDDKETAGKLDELNYFELDGLTYDEINRDETIKEVEAGGGRTGLQGTAG